MRTLFEGGTFVILAIGAHLFLLGMTPQDAGSSSAGESGEAMVSMLASTESVEALVAEWETPPEPELEVTELAALELPVVDALPTPAPQPAPPDLTVPTAIFETDHVNNDVSLPSQTPPPPVFPKPDPAADALAEITPVVKPKPKPKPTPVRPVKAASKPKTVPKPSVNSISSVAQKAAGSGGTTSAGAGKAAVATSQKSAKAQAKELARWQSAIRTRIERRKRRVSAKGSATMQITIARTGALRSVKIISPSGIAMIDTAALNTVKSVGKFPQAPASYKDSSFTFNLTMKFN